MIMPLCRLPWSGIPTTNYCCQRAPPPSRLISIAKWLSVFHAEVIPISAVDPSPSFVPQCINTSKTTPNKHPITHALPEVAQSPLQASLPSPRSSQAEGGSPALALAATDHAP